MLSQSCVRPQAFGRTILGLTLCLERHLGQKVMLLRRVREARKAIRLMPDLAPAHAALGAVLETQLDLKGALAEYQESVRLDPRNEHYKKMASDLQQVSH